MYSAMSRSFWTLRPGSERKGQWAPTPLRYSFVSVILSVLNRSSRRVREPHPFALGVDLPTAGKAEPRRSRAVTVRGDHRLRADDHQRRLRREVSRVAPRFHIELRADAPNEFRPMASVGVSRSEKANCPSVSRQLPGIHGSLRARGVLTASLTYSIHRLDPVGALSGASNGSSDHLDEAHTLPKDLAPRRHNFRRAIIKVGKVQPPIGVQSRLSAASRDRLNPLAPPGRRLEGIREILCLAHDLSVAEFHNTHCVCWSPLVRDGVFRDPEITVSENSLDVEA